MQRFSPYTLSHPENDHDTNEHTHSRGTCCKMHQSRDLKKTCEKKTPQVTCSKQASSTRIHTDVTVILKVRQSTTGVTLNVTQYNERYILSTLGKIEIFALSNRRSITSFPMIPNS